jgi:integrase
VKNLRQTGSGWQKYCRVAGRFCQEHTPERPSVLDVRNWVRAQHMSDEPPKPTSRGNVFQRDVATYLDSVTDMPTYSDREFHMLWWAAIFKGRKRNTITPLEIKTALAKLRETHSPSSCNKRRTALMSFYTAMNGRSGYNPVRDVPKYQEDEEPRDQRMWTAYRILALMRPSQTRARLRVILWTGWPHAQLKRLKPAHLDLAHARAFVTPRRKGKGRKGVWLPLLPGAVIALRDFVKWDCFTPFDEKRQCLVPFSNSAMHSSFARAVAKFNAHRARFGHPPIDAHPYDLRHSFGTMFAERTEDERALQEAMMHSRAEQSRRYTQRATERRVATAFAQVANAKKTA